MSSVKEDFKRQLAEATAADDKKRELAAKELLLRERRVNNELETLEENDRDLQIAQKTNYGAMTEAQIAHLQAESTAYLEAAKKKSKFINDVFEDVVPLFRKNLILIGGKTGEGKSTTVANVVSSTLRQTNPDTGKRCRVLVITNEEKAEDVYNRITCLAKDWAYTNHSKFTPEQIKTFNDYIPILAKDGWLTVVDDSFGSTPELAISGVTTSIEGIEAIFNNLIANNEYYDVVLIDYYQNIKFSKKNPRANEYEVQAKLAARLDQYKNVYPAPIVLLAQVSPPDKDDKTPFKQRIEGRKVILNVATCCLEIIADRSNLRTKWKCHKNRFSESIGTEFYTGFDRGRFVPYTQEFIAKVNEIKERRAAMEADKGIGIKFSDESEAESDE